MFQYLAGSTFELVSDHKPLETIFGENKSLPQMAAGRLQRWGLFLTGFNYKFKHIKGIENTRADAFSRLPSNDIDDCENDDFDYFNFVEKTIPIDKNKLISETRKDPILGQVFKYLRYGFPDKCENELIKPYYTKKS